MRGGDCEGGGRDKREGGWENFSRRNNETNLCANVRESKSRKKNRKKTIRAFENLNKCKQTLFWFVRKIFFEIYVMYKFLNLFFRLKKNRKNHTLNVGSCKTCSNLKFTFQVKFEVLNLKNWAQLSSLCLYYIFVYIYLYVVNFFVHFYMYT